MKYQIDQSGKIEDTAKNTVIAYSNGTQYSIFIHRKIKRQVQEIFRLCGYPKLFVYHLFSVGVFSLIRGLKQKSEIVIDTEYPGKDKIIGDLVMYLLESYGRPQHNISFARIGNRPKAHYAAKDVFDGKLLPNKRLTLPKIIEALKKTDGRLRECLSTLVDARPRSSKGRYHKRVRKSRRKNVK